MDIGRQSLLRSWQQGLLERNDGQDTASLSSTLPGCPCRLGWKKTCFLENCLMGDKSPRMPPPWCRGNSMKLRKDPLRLD